MAYLFYLDKVLLPIAPSKLQLKIKNQNKTLQLINEGEVNILKQAGLTQVDFDVLLPNVQYPFATYNGGFQRAKVYLDKLEALKVSRQPFQFIVTRETPNGTPLYNTNMTVALEDYTIKEDAKQGLDVVVTIKLKQWRNYGTKTCTVTIKEDEPEVPVQATVEEERPTPVTEIGIGSNVIFNGTLYRDSYGNGAGKSLTNYRGQIIFINKKGSHPYALATTSGGALGWVLESSVQGV